MQPERFATILAVNSYSFYARLCMSGDFAEGVDITDANDGYELELRPGFERADPAQWPAGF